MGVTPDLVGSDMSRGLTGAQRDGCSDDVGLSQATIDRWY